VVVAAVVEVVVACMVVVVGIVVVVVLVTGTAVVVVAGSVLVDGTSPAPPVAHAVTPSVKASAATVERETRLKTTSLFKPLRPLDATVGP
jgi:hypothetical protein